MAHKIEDKLEITKSSGNVFADIGLKNADKYLAKAELARLPSEKSSTSNWRFKPPCGVFKNEDL